MKRYPAYKDSGIEWIGEIPSGWSISRIKYTADDGYKTFVDGDWIESEFITDEGIRLIQTGNIGIGFYKEQGFRYISEDTFKQLNCTEVFQGDVLICRLAYPVGRACLAPNLKERMITSVDNCIVKTSNKFHPAYVVYFLSSKYYLDYLETISRGGTRERISRTMLGDLNILALEYTEQEAIATYLDRKTAQIDELIAKKERMIELLEEERTAIISQAVTKGLDPKAEMKDSGIEWVGKLPKHWHLNKLKYVSRVNGVALTEITDESYEFHYIDISNVGIEDGFNIGEKISFGNSPSRARRVVQKGDTIVSTVRTYLKAIAYFEDKVKDVIVSTGFAVISPNKTFIPKYLYYVLRSERFIDRVCALSVGVSYPAINSTELSDIAVWYPDDIEEQNKIVKYLDCVVVKTKTVIARLQSEIGYLKEFRTSLISEVATGKIDVKDEINA